MGKKSAGWLVVLIANILLVTHSILPHQHHGGFVWIPADNYEDHHDPAGAHAEDSDHKHQDHDQDQSCLLAQAYLVPVNVSRFDCPLDDHHNQIPDFQIIYSDSDHSGYYPVFLKIPDPPLLLLGKVSFPVICGFGLRAPPAA